MSCSGRPGQCKNLGDPYEVGWLLAKCGKLEDARGKCGGTGRADREFVQACL